MKQIIIVAMCLSFILIVNSVYADTVLSIYLEVFKNNSVILHELKVMPGTSTSYTVPGNYKLQILDKNNNIIAEKSIGLNFMLMTDPPTPKESSPIDQRIEFNKSMIYVRLFLNGTEIFFKEMNLCNNNGICDEYESYLSCPSDCPLNKPDGICIKDSDEICDPDCSIGSDPDCKETPSTSICGNSICGSNETQENCCKDCGCPKDMSCVDNKCLSDTCGNGVCDNGKNYTTCPQDCPLKSSSRTWIYVVIGIVLAVLLFFIFSGMRGRSEGGEA